MAEWFGLLRSLWIYWRPGRQKGLRALYAPFVGPGDLVFDVGAHLGDRTAAFAALGARVVALEPQPRLQRWLRLLTGGSERVIIRGEAAGARAGTGRLAVSLRSPTLSTLADGWRERLTRDHPGFRGVRWDEVVEVPVTTLDALIETYGVPRFCKIDVEGHEAEVLAGLGRPLPALSVEFVAGALDVATDCVHRLERLGDFEFNVVVGERRRFTFPDWVSAPRMLDWLSEGADGVSSGDIYARSTSDPAPARAAHQAKEGPQNG